MLVVEVRSTAAMPASGATAGRLARHDRLDAEALVGDVVADAVELCEPGQRRRSRRASAIACPRLGHRARGGRLPRPPHRRARRSPTSEVDRPSTTTRASSTRRRSRGGRGDDRRDRGRTGAEVVVYSQVVGYGITTEEADRHAIALMDQWGVGRKGIDDGLVILFDLDPSLDHGQVILYGGPATGRPTSTTPRGSAIFDEDMLPLRQADLDGALRIALEQIDANATLSTPSSSSPARSTPRSD